MARLELKLERAPLPFGPPRRRGASAGSPRRDAAYRSAGGAVRGELEAAPTGHLDRVV